MWQSVESCKSTRRTGVVSFCVFHWRPHHRSSALRYWPQYPNKHNTSGTSVVADLSVRTRQTVKAATGLSRTPGLSAARGTRSTAPRHGHLKINWLFRFYIDLKKTFKNTLTASQTAPTLGHTFTSDCLSAHTILLRSISKY